MMLADVEGRFSVGNDSVTKYAPTEKQQESFLFPQSNPFVPFHQYKITTTSYHFPLYTPFSTAFLYCAFTNYYSNNTKHKRLAIRQITTLPHPKISITPIRLHKHKSYITRMVVSFNKTATISVFFYLYSFFWSKTRKISKHNCSSSYIQESL